MKPYLCPKQRLNTRNMKVGHIHYQTIWFEDSAVYMIDQNLLPFTFSIKKCSTWKETCTAIRTMNVRGAGAIGAAAGFAMAQAFMTGDNPAFAREQIRSARPTARDLFYAVDKVFNAGIISVAHALATALEIAVENQEAGRKIGSFGETMLKDGARVLTHCNAGWLAFVDYGSALSPIYQAHRKGKKIFVYVDETRPRSQGARLTAWELMNEEIEHLIVPDNAGAYLMSQGKVDMVITGADRIAANGDTANKIGTFEKAIVANHFGVPFYVAAPCSTFDFDTLLGKDIEIEQRNADEVNYQTGPDVEGKLHTIRVSNPGSDALNPAFDVTPAGLISGFITEKGIVAPGRIRKIL
ncbi:MAG: S-methyl-5-thioribose-1-phosphate isomerase [Lentimicrobium sp.]|nr:S-methyl-5-thioribose-1-phosphate isomerase [Lentimicrobium sp.]